MEAKDRPHCEMLNYCKDLETRAEYPGEYSKMQVNVAIIKNTYLCTSNWENFRPVDTCLALDQEFPLPCYA